MYGKHIIQHFIANFDTYSALICIWMLANSQVKSSHAIQSRTYVECEWGNLMDVWFNCLSEGKKWHANNDKQSKRRVNEIQWTIIIRTNEENWIKNYDVSICIHYAMVISDLSFVILARLSFSLAVLCIPFGWGAWKWMFCSTISVAIYVIAGEISSHRYT